MRALSRRDFLKLSGLGLLGLSLPKPGQFSFLPSPVHSFLSPGSATWAAPEAGVLVDDSLSQQGRVTARLIWIFDQPSFNARHVNLYWRDSIVDISGVCFAGPSMGYGLIGGMTCAETIAYYRNPPPPDSYTPPPPPCYAVAAPLNPNEIAELNVLFG